MKVGSGGNLDLSKEYSTQLFEPMFYPWRNCPLISTSTRNAKYEYFLENRLQEGKTPKAPSFDVVIGI